MQAPTGARWHKVADTQLRSIARTASLRYNAPSFALAATGATPECVEAKGAAYQPMPTSAEEKNLRIRLGELQNRHATLTKRIAALDTDIDRALDSLTKQVRAEERSEMEAERNRVAAEMAQIERQLNEPIPTSPTESPPSTECRPRRWFGQLPNAGKVAVIVGIGLMLAALICGVAEIIIPSPASVVLRTEHNRYVTALKDDPEGGRAWMLWAETAEISYWEKFRLRCVKDGKAALQTYHGKYATATGENRDWVLVAETEEIGESEKYTLYDASTKERLLCSDVLQALEQGPVSLALQTTDGWYVTAMDGGQDGSWIIRGHAATINEWEKFTVIEP